MTIAVYSSSAFTTATGIAVAAAAAVEVRREDTGALATIYSDEAGTIPIAQPGFVADANGRFEFYAAGLDRGYRVTVTKGAETNVHNHAAVGTAGQRDASDFVTSNTDSDITGGKTFKSFLRLDGVISPTTVTVDTNDYNPTSLSTANTLRVSTDALRAFTGLQGTASGRIVVWINVASFNQILRHENTGSIAGNRFNIGGDILLLPGQQVVLIYDNTSQRWRLWSHTSLRFHGMCRLTKSGANLLLSPKDGNTIIINGRVEVIPDAGVTLAGPTNTVTMTIATPAVVTFNAHGMAVGQPVIFNTTGALPTGVTAGTTYYIIAAGFGANSFQFSATQGGAAVNTSGVQSGVHTLTGPVHYIYAYMSGATMTLEAGLTSTANAAQAGTGVVTKSGDATRTLVGMARAVNNAWVDSAAQRLVISYFNRRDINLLGRFTADRTTGSATYVELNAEIRIEHLTWADEAISYSLNGTAASNIAANVCVNGLGIDSVTAATAGLESGVVSAQPGYYAASPINGSVLLSEGYHFTTLLGSVTAASTGTWVGVNAVASAKLVTNLLAKVRG